MACGDNDIFHIAGCGGFLGKGFLRSHNWCMKPRLASLTDPGSENDGKTLLSERKSHGFSAHSRCPPSAIITARICQGCGRGLILNPLIDVSFRSPFAQRVAFLLRRRKPKYRDSLLITQASSAGSDHDTKSASEGKPDRDTCPSSPSHSQSLHIAFGSSRDKYPRESSSLARSRKPARLVGADGVYCPPCCAFPRPPVCQRVCSRSFRCGGRPGLATR
jgi:hypothetical protein